jgi:hypothetical protein
MKSVYSKSQLIASLLVIVAVVNGSEIFQKAYSLMKGFFLSGLQAVILEVSKFQS